MVPVALRVFVKTVVLAAVLLVSSRVSAEVPSTVLWSTTFDAGDNSLAWGIGRGPDGHPVVAGYSCAIGTSDCALRAIKYDSADGSALWNVTFQSSGGNDGGFAVTVGADDHPIVAGSSCDRNGEHCTTRLIKFDGATGDILWNITDSSGHGSNGAYGVAVGADGHPVTVEWSCLADSSSDCELRVAKFDGASGARLWSATFASGQGYEQPSGVAIGADGHAVVTGISCAPTYGNCDVRTMKFDGSNGAVIWNVSFDTGIETPDTTGDYAAGVALTSDNHPVVNGSSCLTSSCDASATRTIKYDGLTGAMIWNVTRADPSDVGVAVGSDGHPVSAGGGTITKLDGATGAPIWTVTTVTAADVLNAVTMGLVGNPLVTGYACDGAGGCAFRTVKYLIQWQTPAGSHVAVELNGGATVPDGIGMTFSEVTNAGDTSVVAGTTAPPPPSGYQFVGPPATFWDITTTATFTGSIQVCVNYATRPFNPPETSLTLLQYENDAWVDVTTMLDTSAKIICGSTTSLSPFTLAQPTAAPATVGPLTVWLGLQNGPNRGLRFDLRVEVFRNGTQLLATGALADVPGGGPGFDNASQVTIPLSPKGMPTLAAGSTLSVELSVRNACASTGADSGAARLWFGDKQADSRLTMTIGGATRTFYLQSPFVVSRAPGRGKTSLQVESGARCSAFKTFGTWTIVVQ